MFGKKLVFKQISLHHGYGTPLEFVVRDISDKKIKIDFDEYNRDFIKKNYDLGMAIIDLEKILDYLKQLDNEDVDE